MGRRSYVNEFDHRVTITTGEQGADLIPSFDEAWGTATSTDNVTIAIDTLVYHTTDLSDDTLGSSHGTVTTTEGIVTTITADVVAATRTVHLGQNGSGECQGRPPALVDRTERLEGRDDTIRGGMCQEEI